MKILTLSLLLSCTTIAFAAETSTNNPHANNPHANNPHADQSSANGASNNGAPVDHSAFFQQSDQQPEPDIESMLKAEVVSVLDTKGYTYIEISRDDEPVWLAVPTTAVDAGDTVYYTDGPIVRDHESRTLNRTFPTVIFLLSVVVKNDK